MKKIFLLICLISAPIFADEVNLSPPHYQVLSINHQEGNLENSKMDLILLNLTSSEYIRFDMGYPNSSLMTCSVVLPGNEKLFVAGVDTKMDMLWMAEYDIKQKKLLVKYDSLLKSYKSGWAREIFWDADKKVIGLTINTDYGRILITIDPAKNKVINKEQLAIPVG